MKHCPQCNRVESDDALAFCRVDGTALVNDSGAINGEAGTAKFVSATVSSEIETSVLSHRTDAEINRPTAPTTVLPATATPSTTRELTKLKGRKIVFGLTALVILVLAIGGYFFFSRKATPAIQSIAVMPFVNASGNADLDYLSDGMTETLISSLSQLPKLNVKARSSVFRYKGKETDAKTIGRELNVQAILNGRVIQRGDQLTLSLELIDAQTENVIWSESYNREQADLVSLQSEIARDVSSKLRLKLSGADAEKVAKTYTKNPEAYRLYLQGRFYWNKREEKDFRRAVEYFNQANRARPELCAGLRRSC
jgi:TolB-like protein